MEKVDTCLENYCFVVAVQKAWYKSATENWDWERSDGDGKETAEYSCPGWSCSREILDKILNNRLTFHDIPLNARESLARKVELDEREIDKWGQELQGWIDGNGIRVTVRVPNVWITANILAFDPSFTGTLAALGGIVGSMGTSVSNIFSGMMEVKCGNLGELAFALNRFKGKIWGLSLFAHGSKDGLISDTPGVNNCTWQESLITAVQQNNYKLGRINLMQCFSGFFGKTTRIVKSTNPQETLASMRLRLEKYFKSFPYISVRKINTQYKTGGTKPASPDDPIIAEIEMTVLWAYVWSTLAVKLRKYQNQNICLLDI